MRELVGSSIYVAVSVLTENGKKENILEHSTGSLACCKLQIRETMHMTMKKLVCIVSWI